MVVLHLVKTSVGAMWALRLMRELVAQGIEVHVALPCGGPCEALYREAGITTHDIDFSLRRCAASVRALRQLVDRLRPDIIHSHFVVTTLVMRLALRRDPTPRIFEVPGPLHLEHLLTRRLELLTAQACDYWIPTCRWSYERYLRSRVPPERLHLGYYGGEIARERSERGVLRRELGLGPDDLLVGMVAYMYPPKRLLGQCRGLKGHEDFIDAMALLCARHPNLHGVCIGGAWGGAVDYERRIRRYGAEHCPQVTFLGTRRDVATLYRDLDCAVHPSHSENLGGAGESLALGVPTVATTVGGFPDIVIDGWTGLLVPPRSPRELAAAIERMITDRAYAARLAAAGKRYVERMLDVRETSADVARFYDEVLRREAHRRKVKQARGRRAAGAEGR